MTREGEVYAPEAPPSSEALIPSPLQRKQKGLVEVSGKGGQRIHVMSEAFRVSELPSLAPEICMLTRLQVCHAPLHFRFGCFGCCFGLGTTLRNVQKCSQLSAQGCSGCHEVLGYNWNHPLYFGEGFQSPVGALPCFGGRRIGRDQGREGLVEG